MLSIIVPTKHNIRQLNQLLDSINDTISNGDSIEVILVVDESDMQSRLYNRKDLRIKTVVVPDGLSMGTLNNRGYEAASGDHLMLLNDDVIVRSKNWDKRIRESFEKYADGIVLVHVNDGIYKQRICVFPCLTRRFAELAGKICPGEYLRYKIDDHINDIFRRLAAIGYIRIVYLHDVLFEHQNYVYKFAGFKLYQTDKSIHVEDDELFDSLGTQREGLAVKLASVIDGEDPERLYVAKLTDRLGYLFNIQLPKLYLSIANKLHRLIFMLCGGVNKRT